MTRLRILSDVHCEFVDYTPDAGAADVVVLAGDIHHGVQGLTWARSSFPDQPIVYVAGNHEYYGEAIPTLTDALRVRAKQLDIAFLENEAIEIAGVRFLGCTLWTDFQLFGPDPRVIEAVLGVMADYRAIRVGPDYRRLRPADTTVAHRESVRWLREQSNTPASTATVVVTHHAPSARSIAAHYGTDPVSAAFASRLDDLVESIGAALWIHGHTHHCIDYAIGSTRVVSNQRGYVGEQTGFIPDLTIDLP